MYNAAKDVKELTPVIQSAIYFIGDKLSKLVKWEAD